MLDRYEAGDSAGEIAAQVSKAKSGNNEAWSLLLNEPFKRKLFRQCRKEVRNPDHLDEAWSRTCEKIHEEITKLRDPSKFEGWVYVIFLREARRISVTWTKSAAKCRTDPDVGVRDVGYRVGDTPKAGNEPTAEDVYLQAVEAEEIFGYRLGRMLRRMGSAERVAFDLHLRTGFKGVKLAAELSERSGTTVTANAANVRLFRARATLQEAIYAARLASMRVTSPGVV